MASRNKRVVVQEFIEGRVIGVESFTFDSEVRPFGRSRRRSDPPRASPEEWRFPSRLNSQTLSKVLAANEQAIKYGDRWGPTHIIRYGSR